MQFNLSPSWIGLFLISMATWQIVEVWHHGSIFAGARARLEVSSFRFVAELLLCPFCLSIWAGFFCTALYVLPLGDIALAGLVASRMANLANDLTYRIAKTPNRKYLFEKRLSDLAK